MEMLIELKKGEKKPSFSSSCITEDRTYLNLAYPDFSNNCELQGYNDYLDKLDSEVSTYSKVNRLVINTDYINSLPKNVCKFKNLIDLTVSGSRFWDLTMEKVPHTVEKLNFTNHSSLSLDSLKGMEK